jgi:hypothetical protein
VKIADAILMFFGLVAQNSFAGVNQILFWERRGGADITSEITHRPTFR